MKIGRFAGSILLIVVLMLSFTGCGGSGSSSDAADKEKLEQANQAQEEQKMRDEELDKTFPKQDAAKAVVVALTNSIADDVFKPDGNTYDPNKLHNFSWCVENGLFAERYTSEAKDGEWLIALTLDQMKNGQKTNRSYTASAYVSRDGDNYIVRIPGQNIRFKTYKMDGLEITNEVIDQGNYSLIVHEGDVPLIVSPDLLK